MRILKRITEPAMVAAFVSAEFNSARFGKTTRQIVKEFEISPEFITQPNVESRFENQARAIVLNKWRGYSSRTKLFEGFPDRVRWYRATLDFSDMHSLYYGRSPKYWSPLSFGTYRVEDGVRYIFSMPKNGNPAKFVRSIYQGIKVGESFPPIIALTDLPRSKLVLIEGSARSTAHFKAMSDGLVRKLNAIVGASSKIESWDLWIP